MEKNWFYELMNKKWFYELVIMLGAVIIFCSWIVQNYFEKSFQMQRERMERIENIGNKYDNYAKSFEVASSSFDTNKIALLKRNYILCSLNLFNTINKILKRDPTMAKYQDSIKQAKIEPSSINEAYLTRNFEMLNKVSVVMKEAREKNEPFLIAEFYNNYMKICEMENDWNRKFVIIYAIGAVVSGFGLFLKKRKELEKDTK